MDREKCWGQEEPNWRGQAVKGGLRCPGPFHPGLFPLLEWSLGLGPRVGAGGGSSAVTFLLKLSCV